MKDKQLLALAMQQIDRLTKQLERTDRKREQQAQKKGTSRYHVEIKARCMAMLANGQSMEECREQHGVTLGALSVWKREYNKERTRQAKKRSKRNRKTKG